MISSYILNFILLLISFTMIFPFVWTLCASFKTRTQIHNGNPFDLIPRPFTLRNYERAWEMMPFTRFLINSLALSILIPTLMVLLSSLSGYAFAKLKFKGRNVIFLAILSTMMMPGHVTLIPNYVIMRVLNWIDKYIALIVHPLFTGSSAFNIFFFRQFFLSIPKDLEDAAIIDGCTRARMFFSIVMPNSKPAIATVAILSFRSVWNSFLWPSIVMNTYEKMTITVGLQYFKAMVSGWGELLAGTTVALIPMLVVFIIFQKYFIRSTLNTGFGGQ
ncbi:MAG TPA: carbohydrate ABC transporter permease [Tepidanaerobacter syntrophicus]|nr:carbohydrate ABC transporter permease [Tepidanaerobacter syntrophicus]